MSDMETLELLKAAIAVAVADGKVTRSEKGVLQGLATRVGVGKVSFDAMIDTAKHDKGFADNILIQTPAKARMAIELLVAQARIDGQISSEERELIVRISSDLGIKGDDFQTLYESGIARADRLRKARKGEG